MMVTTIVVCFFGLLAGSASAYLSAARVEPAPEVAGMCMSNDEP